MGFIIFHRHHSLNFGWVSIFESKQNHHNTYELSIKATARSPRPPAPHCGCSSWCRCYGVRAAFFQWLVVIQAGLSCDCLSVPAVQVSGCSAQQVQTGRHMTTPSSQALVPSGVLCSWADTLSLLSRFGEFGGSGEREKNTQQN